MSEANLKDFACPRCNGSKVIPCLRHVDGGKCFKCDGTGRVARLAAVPVRKPATGYAIVRAYRGAFAFLVGCKSWAEALVERDRRKGIIAKYKPDGSLWFRDGSRVPFFTD